ncbi:hypothetical protein BDY17DRAFT_323102 [Neohortaea acidophila]|uniref:Uncharacterized protein n=1 Tax=Neohortaea acidophila TaxID=245834 RepID=A0A6A6PWY2_9PEZI|nr:uncharacterized protein BDY17DRAFT_323102 [Neohortaea acidophila]KAF2484234.1 hypothetical protein BDY17DRAFT_323102 [Neohortaea acidophila]
MPYYGPGMPWYGRGAGNIQAAQQGQARMAEDLEANHQPVRPSLTRSLTCPTCQKCEDPSHERYYFAGGRGGAASYTAAPAHHFQQLDSAAEASFKSIRNGTCEATAKTQGRGGLGNYAAGLVEREEDAKRKGRKLDSQRERLRLDVEKGVDDALAMPARAKLPLSSPKDVSAPGAR